MMKKNALILLVLLSVAFIFAGCSDNGGNLSGSASATATVNNDDVNEEIYNAAGELLQNGDVRTALQKYMSIYQYKDSFEQYYKNSHYNQIATSVRVVACKKNGTVFATSSSYGEDMYNGGDNVSAFKNAKMIGFTLDHTYVLKGDGNIEITENIYGGTDDILGDPHSAQCQCDFTDWKNISYLDVDSVPVGISTEGKVYYQESFHTENWNVDDWDNVIAADSYGSSLAGVTKEGTVLFNGDTDFAGKNIRDTSQWQDIVAVALGECHTVGLKSDGTVVATGSNRDGQCDVNDWTDIIAIAVGNYHTIGLKVDGTVVTAGNNQYGACKTSSWEDVVGIYGSYYNTVGLKSDGTLYYIGEKGMDKAGYKMMSAYKCDDWNLFDDSLMPENYTKLVPGGIPNSTSKPSQSTSSRETVSQQNARQMAKDYLKYTAFSRQGLIKQLEFEGFSNSDAVYGVDYHDTNWKEQAAKCAKSYLDYSAFSRKGLIEQLEYEGFTYEQAVYGVDSTGL